METYLTNIILYNNGSGKHVGEKRGDILMKGYKLQRRNNYSTFWKKYWTCSIKTIRCCTSQQDVEWIETVWTENHSSEHHWRHTSMSQWNGYADVATWRPTRIHFQWSRLSLGPCTQRKHYHCIETLSLHWPSERVNRFDIVRKGHHPGNPLH